MQKRVLLWITAIISVCGVVASFWLVTRERACQNPWQVLLRDDSVLDAYTGSALPAGWVAGAPGVRTGEFSVAGGASIHMLGIAAWLGIVDVPVVGEQRYCIALRALADSPSATAIRTRWIWKDTQGIVAERVSPWHRVRRWNGAGDVQPWTRYTQSDRAPAMATMLEIRIEPASDDRLYLDQIVVKMSRVSDVLADEPARAVTVHPWPAGYTAAVSFSYDWETAMGGLVHSRSIDPLADVDPELRGMRMREGVTTTLALFAPYHIPATYFVNGYNFLNGNLQRHQFMGNPTYTWASQQNGWQSDAWVHVPWFSRDPFGDASSHPAWYFGDLINRVRNEGHDIQSHTFSHLYGGLASPAEWYADIQAWNAVAATRGVAPASALAFPWSSSAGMRYDTWDLLVRAGFTTLTRTAWNPRLPQYHIVSAQAATCRGVPGHEQLLACPDYYLTVDSQAGALEMIRRIRGHDGMIDFWAHTEEVVSPAQQQAWRTVVSAVAHAGDIWVAPLRHIADRQRAIAALRWRHNDENGLEFTVSNPTRARLDDIWLTARPGFVFADTRTSTLVFTLMPYAHATIRIVPDDASLP